MELARLLRREAVRDGHLAAPRPIWRLLAPLRRWVRGLEEQRAFLWGTGGLISAGIFALLVSNLRDPAEPLALAGLLLQIAFVLGVLGLYVRRVQPKEVQHPRSMALLGVVILVTLALVRGALLLAASLAQRFPQIPVVALHHAVPVPVGGALLAVLFNSRLAFAGSLAISILAALMVGAPFPFFLFAFVGSLMAVFATAGQQDRGAFFRAGGWVGAANLYTLAAFALVEGGGQGIPWAAAGSLLNGLFVAVLATGLLPPLEYLFEATTNFRLLELSNLNHPVLKHLILTAPGTYYHSVMVGTLAEAAAEAVEANSLLCRVGAYYHDIGKTKKPAYFIENQPDALNRHDKLAPHLSTLVVMSHVKEGIELAEAYGLPPAIVDLIPQHHGTRLVHYFYEKAKAGMEPDLRRIPEGEYRYPGPKPQTREAAILMLADAVEAASRTLTEPTPARIQGATQRIMNGILTDGQLDECDLTLRDLHVVEESFVRVLTGIFHHRVDYPGIPLQDVGREGDGGPGPKSPAEDPARHAAPQTGGGGGPGPPGVPGG